MSGFLCSMVGASFITAAAEVIRAKKGITAVGNAQVDTAQSQFGGASALFDGTDDYLVANTSEALTGDFTMECWFRAANISAGYRAMVVLGNEATGRFVLFMNGSSIGCNVYGSATYDIVSTSAIAATTWYHITVVKNGSTQTLYLDGVSKGSVTAASSYGNTGGYYIGNISTLTDDFNGHIDEVRISKIARYTTTFTPSTTPFVNDANTLLLIHCDGTDASTFFEDDNGVRAQVGITAVATAQVDTAQSKFGGTSLLLDGDSDYLSVLSSDGTFNFGTSEDFTIECWIRATTVDEYHTVIASNNSSYASSAVTFTGGASAQKLRFNVQGIGNVLIDSTALSANTWYHVAVTRSGSSWNLWRDGTSVSSTTNAGVPVNFEGNGGFNIGWTRWDGAVAYWTGYIDEFRISSIARYTTTFTPSTTPFVNDANTLLLIHADGTDASTFFTDDNGSRASRGITAVGNAQVDTAQSKFGGTSLLLDGTGDYLTTDSASLAVGTGDFTFECWARASDTNGFMLFDQTTPTGSSNGYSIWLQVSTLNVYSGGWILQTVGTINTNTWYHIAVTRSGSSLRAFIDGTQVGSTITTSNNISQTPLFMGAARIDTSTYDGNGYMDEIRISNNARYTANFTAPTAPFQNDANTLLLIHCDGTDASTVFTDDNGTQPV